MKFGRASVFIALLYFPTIPNIAAQDVASHFKWIREAILIRAVKPANSNAAIILTSEGFVLIDSGRNPPDPVALSETIKKLTRLRQ